MKTNLGMLCVGLIVGAFVAHLIWSMLDKTHVEIARSDYQEEFAGTLSEPEAGRMYEIRLVAFSPEKHRYVNIPGANMHPGEIWTIGANNKPERVK